MPQCSECRMLSDNQCLAYDTAKETLGRPIPPPPLGGCTIPIVEDYLSLIQPGMRILEIGCGTWTLIKQHCNRIGATYEGIDTQAEYFGKPTIATRIENLAELSFPDDSFDLVIGNQTMEHWAEYGCSLEWGLHQCFRACKTGGMVLLNVPIHFHGTRIFMLGELARIEQLFAPFSDQVTLHPWGQKSEPLENLYPYPGYWKLRNHPAYVLDIQAVKDRALPSYSNNRYATRGYLAQLLNYPFSYNIYRVLSRMGLVRFFRTI
jgi:SAM-dependent methyltransferase